MKRNEQIIDLLRLFSKDISDEDVKIRVAGGYVRDKLSNLDTFHDFDIVIQGYDLMKFVDEFCGYVVKMLYNIRTPYSPDS